jgi:hypothetical protein
MTVETIMFQASDLTSVPFPNSSLNPEGGWSPLRATDPFFVPCLPTCTDAAETPDLPVVAMNGSDGAFDQILAEIRYLIDFFDGCRSQFV